MNEHDGVPAKRRDSENGYSDASDIMLFFSGGETRAAEQRLIGQRVLSSILVMVLVTAIVRPILTEMFSRKILASEMVGDLTPLNKVPGSPRKKMTKQGYLCGRTVPVERNRNDVTWHLKLISRA